MHRGSSFFLFSLSLFLFLIILPLTRQGMFLDGVFYASVAKNLSLGYGSLWQPFFSKTIFPIFYEHPPLAIYFQSLLFKQLGPGFGTEQLYSLLMAISQITLISCYWLNKQRAPATHLGFLLFLWLLIPLNHLYVSNHLEATLTLFTTFASLILLIPTQKKLSLLIQYGVSSVSILLAFFCNGPTAFFPLVVPFLQVIHNNEISLQDGIQRTCFLIILTLFLWIGFYILAPEALLNTQHYFEQQLLPSITGSRQLDHQGMHHLHILYLYFRAYGVVSIFVLACLFMATKINGVSFQMYIKQALSGKEFLFFFSLSLLSSLPVGVSHKQALNYIMPSAPFYTLAMMGLCFESYQIIFHRLEKTSSYKRLCTASYILFIASLLTVFYLSKGFNRDKPMIEDIQSFLRYCEPNTTLSTSPTIFDHWYTGAYLARYSMLSVTPTLGNHYYLGLKNEALPKDYHWVNIPLSYYVLAELDHPKT